MVFDRRFFASYQGAANDMIREVSMPKSLYRELPLRRVSFVLLMPFLVSTLALAEEPGEVTPTAEEPVEVEPETLEEPEALEQVEPEVDTVESKEEEEDLAKLREEMRIELRDEIREELLEEMLEELADQRAELRAEVRESIAAGLTAQQWEPDRWVVEPPTRPAFFELDGYLRARGDVFVNLDMNAGVDVHGQPLFPSPATAGSDTLTSANQRLRLDPVFNVSEELRVRATVDILDNLVWGQSSELVHGNVGARRTPLLVFSDTQVAPLAGVNAARDSLSVKRAWAEVTTPFGWLHFGRMGSHWGLGMLVNDGDELDSDHGSSVDRLMFVVPVGDHFMMPLALDIMSSGPIFQPLEEHQGQPFGLENRDTAIQYLLALARRDTDEEIRRQVLDGRMVLNYGMYNLLRRQVLEFVGQDDTQRPIYTDGELSRRDFIRRDAIVYIPDVWFRLSTSRLRIEVEAAAVLGRIGNGLLEDEADPLDDTSVSIAQFGAVAEGEYRFMQERLRVGMQAGFASGDNAPGMGIHSAPGGRREYPEPGAIDGRQFNLDPELGRIDSTLNNFRFHRAFYVDEILWRRVFGQVTDAIYLKPTLSFDLATAFGFDLAAIYSRAVFASSTPGDSADLGLELNGGIRYVSRDGFLLRGVYGILFPFEGLQLEDNRRPEIAQVIRGVVAVTF